jgi:glycosyltransferase involved in cell wall biosynthesis
MPRPLWSVMIPTFRCARFLRRTLDSVLSQDPGQDVMQIEVVDDCSNNDTASVPCPVASDHGVAT